LHFSLGGIAVFREFSQCSHTSFILAVAAGALCIAALAVVTAVTGNALFIKAGLVLGLFVARLSEAVRARNCSLAKAGLEGIILAVLGVLLVAADDLVRDYLV